MGDGGKERRPNFLRQPAWKLWEFSSALENIDLCLCYSSRRCFKLKPPSPAAPLPCPPLWHWAASVLCGFMKVAHQSHDVIHSLLTTLSSGLSSTFNSTDPSLQKGFSIKVSLRSRRLFFGGGFLALGCRIPPECCTSLMNLIAACTSAIRTLKKHFGGTKQPFH